MRHTWFEYDLQRLTIDQVVNDFGHVEINLGKQYRRLFPTSFKLDSSC